MTKFNYVVTATENEILVQVNDILLSIPIQHDIFDALKM